MTELINLVPLIIMAASGLLVLLLKIFGIEGRFHLSLALLGLALAIFAFSYIDFDPVQGTLYFVDGFGRLLSILIFLTTIGVFCYSYIYLENEQLPFAEWTFLLLLAAAGLSLMVSSYHLIVLFVGLELSSLSFYILCGYRRESSRSMEASLKYFILGSVGSAVLLLGIALFYAAQAPQGETTTLFLHQISYAELAGIPSFWVSLFVVGLGLTFKLSLVPLQFWVPDVYEGAPTPVTAFMSVAVKIAVVGVFVRLLSSTQVADIIPWSDVLFVLSVLTMFGGNLIALAQESVKRMLAYSSIAHAGYITLGLAAGSRDGFSAAVFYLAVYLVMNVTAFGLVYLAGESEDSHYYQDLHGLSQSNPVMALCLAVCMISLAGLPPTAGFMGKLMLFYSVIQAGYPWVAVGAVIASVISVAFYFRVIVHSYMRPAEIEDERVIPRLDLYASTGSVAAMLFLLLVGVMPSWLYTVIGSVVAQVGG